MESTDPGANSPVAGLSSAHLALGPDKNILTLSLTFSQEKEDGDSFLPVVLGKAPGRDIGVWG